MTNIGYTLMTEQAGPKALIRHATAAENAGFDFEVSSDHCFPWLEELGHSQVGPDHQDSFFEAATAEILPELRRR